MNALAQADAADIRVKSVRFEDERLVVELMDGRAIAAPLAFYPRLFDATPQQRDNWVVAGAGYGIHWPDVDEDVSTRGLLAGGAAPPGSADWRSPLMDS